jgi:hypothetical protein
MKKHSMSHFRTALKNITITTDSDNDKLGIPLFQAKMGGLTSKHHKSNASLFSSNAQQSAKKSK